MNVKKMSFIFLIALFLEWPPSIRAQVPPSFETPPVVTEMEAQRFIDEYEKVKGKFTVTPLAILTCGDFLTAQEVRCWQILRNRQDKDKKHDGYHKFPEEGQKMGG